MNERAHAVLKKLTDDGGWDGLIKRLGAYALRRSSRKSWRTRNPRELPGGETVDSVVSKAIKMVYMGAVDDSYDPERRVPGVRRWDPDKHPDLEIHLMGVIKSILSHLATGADNTRLDQTPPEEAVADVRTSTPEDKLIEREESARDARLLELLTLEADDHPVDGPVLRGIRENRKAAEIAELLGTDVREVYRAYKRILRRGQRIGLELQTRAQRQPV